jgi:hypothetical protein
MKRWALSFLVSLTAFSIFACAPSRTAKLESSGAPPPGLTLERLMENLSTVHEVKGIAEMEFVSPAKKLDGLASIAVSADAMSVNVYSLGVLAGEFYETDGPEGHIITSDPPLSPLDKYLMVTGIRAGLMWWAADAGEVREHGDQTPQSAQSAQASEEGGIIVIQNMRNKTALEMRTLKPVIRDVLLIDGRTLHVRYDDVVWLDGAWYPGRVEAVLDEHRLTIVFSEVTFGRR